ncbi:MAG: OmpA family protein [Flavobacteriales bacterium]|nr:OmpA family protein [Flavobacteriales bacterium]MBT6815885.1 OmpA family protein [Flavobacteriales bacterium]
MCRLFLLLVFSFQLSISYSQDSVLISDSISIDTLSPLLEKINEYKLRYKVNCVQDKITDNRGNGFEDLYGTRNFRVILHGVAYRGGGNNYYHRSDKRNNKNPLPMDGLNNLLENGFSTSVYLYTENFKTAPPFLVNAEHPDTLKYYQLGGNTSSSLDSILMFTYNSIINKDIGPVYLHCWNGWHQSGFVSAVLLKQFCDFNTESSLHYWEDCADNWTRGYDRIRNAIRDFQPIEKYKISTEIKNEICPCYEDERANDVVVENNNDELKSLKISVLFPSNISDLPPSVSTFLDEYAAMLKENNYLHIEIAGHTDVKGEKSQNLLLSEQRAKSVQDYLILQGVDTSQLSYKGFGEEFPLNECVEGVWCTEEKHAKNRRIEFNISSISYQVKFQKNSTIINQKDKLVLNDILMILKSEEGIKIEIGGHADKGTGDDFVNDNISHLRAERIYNYLKDKEMDMTNITFKGYGSRMEKYGNERDRRIEFKILENKRKEIYVVKKGDYLNKIAKQYGLKVLDIKEWNNLSSDHLSIGDKLILYNSDE